MTNKFQTNSNESTEIAIIKPTNRFVGLMKDAINSTDAMVEMVARSIRDEPVLEKVEDITESKSYCVVYNPASFDSVYAAAQLVSVIDLGITNCVAHSYLETLDNLSNVEQNTLLVCGTELSKESMISLLTGTDKKLVLFAYRDSYTWLDDRAINRWGDRLEIVKQDDEYVNELINLTDNTAIWMTYSWLYAMDIKNGMTSMCLPFINASRVTAVRTSALAFPIVSDLASLGSVAPREEEIRYKSILFNMFPQLRSALRHRNPIQKLRDIELDTKTDSYLDHWRSMGQTFQRACTKQLYRAGNQSIVVPTIACTEMLHYEMISMAALHNDSIVTYEDLHGLRVWRIFTKDRSLRSKLLSAIGGRDWWIDGLCICTYTQLNSVVA